MTIIHDIRRRRLESAYVHSLPFDEAKTELNKARYRIISLEENAKLGMLERARSEVFTFGTYVKEGIIYIPDKGRFLTKNSPIVENPKEATQCGRSGKNFYINDSDVEKSLENSVQIPFGEKISEDMDKKTIPTNRFGDDEITVFAFGEISERYGYFLRAFRVNEISLLLNYKDYVNEQGRPFANQLSFSGTEFSKLILEAYNIEFLTAYYCGRVRGVSESTKKEDIDELFYF